MTRVCTICAHPQREAIDKALRGTIVPTPLGENEARTVLADIRGGGTL